MAGPILDVFLSSTALDLEPHRSAIYAELTSTGLFRCFRQEDFGAQDSGAVEFCRNKVKASEIFIGLVGQRRGWEPLGDNEQRSITEMEHSWAREAGCRRYLYVAPDDFAVPANLRDPDELHVRQQAFRKRVMDGGERIVSQKGFEDAKAFAAGLVKHLLTQIVTGDLITRLRPELSLQSRSSIEEQRPAIAAAVERLAYDEDVDLLALAKDPKNIDLGQLELKLKERAEELEANARPSLKSSAEYWRHIGAFAFLHNTAKAIASFERAVALDKDEPEGWRFLGELQFRTGDILQAERSFDRVLSIGKLSNDDTVRALGCLRLAWIPMNSGDWDSAKTLVTDAVKFAESAGWREGLARAYGNLGIILEARGESDEAERMQCEALAVYHEIADKRGVARTSANLGTLYLRRGELTKADEMHRKALAIFEQANDMDSIAWAYISLGNILEHRRQSDDAYDMYINSLALFQEIHNRRGVAESYVPLGRIHASRIEFDKSAANYRQAMDLYQELNQKEGMAYAHFGLARCHHANGDKRAECRSLRRARDLFHMSGLPKQAMEMEKVLKQHGCTK